VFPVCSEKITSLCFVLRHSLQDASHCSRVHTQLKNGPGEIGIGRDTQAMSHDANMILCGLAIRNDPRRGHAADAR
jgi:hypothetical protein